MRRPVTLLATSTAAAAALAFLPAVAGAAQATAPRAAVPSAAALGVRDQGLNGVASTMAQTNGAVQAVAYDAATKRVYAGGSFTAARPAGSNVNTVTTSVVAVSAATGNPATNFVVQLNGAVNGIAVSAGGSTVYIVGTFTTVTDANSTSSHDGLVAVDATTGAVRTGFTAQLTSNGNAAIGTAVVVGPDGLYVSGEFTSVGGQSRTRLAKLNPATGAVDTGFSADLNHYATALDVAPASSTVDRLLVGGNQTTVTHSGTATTTGGMASVDPDSGAVQTWLANRTIPINTTCAGRIRDITHTGTTVIVGGEGDPAGCWEGTYAARASDGTLLWDSDCLGATQAVAVIAGRLYKGSHQHDCSYTRGDARGGYAGSIFADNDASVHQHLLSQSLADGSFYHWSPNTNSGAGAATDGRVGPRGFATDGTQLFVGGDFTKVNGIAQHGLARFAPGGSAGPDTTDAPITPFVQATSAGTLTVHWPATYDPDSGTLTYRLYRGSKLVDTQTRESYPWTLPQMGFNDRVGAGVAASYTVTASDGTHTSAHSAAATGRGGATTPADYATITNFLKPVTYYKMDASNADSTGRGNTMLNTGVGSTRPVLAGGVVDGGHGRYLAGGAYETSTSPLTLSSFSTAIWFRTTSTTGGVLMGMSTARSGSGGTTDRALMLDNNGNLVFTVRTPPVNNNGLVISQAVARGRTRTWHDGSWHLAVATYNGSTAYLYVDGQYVAGASGTAANSNVPMYPRIGYASTSTLHPIFGSAYGRTWPITPNFTGVVDDAAVYNKALSYGDVQALYAAGVTYSHTLSAPTVPTTCFGKKPTIVNRTGGVVRGTRKADVIVVPTNRPTTVYGRGGNDRICGATTVKGGPGNDKISYRGGTSAANLKGGTGNDKILGGAGSDRLAGGPGRDVIKGGKGDDRLRGGPGNDRLYGNAGNDRLRGGPGRDFGNGGPGTDTCRGVERKRHCES